MNPAALILALLLAPASALDLPAVEARARALMKESCPSLVPLTLEVAETGSSFDFFSTSVRKGWRPPAERIYVLRVSPRLLDDPPEPAALDAILLHELAHLEGFSRMTRGQLLGLALRYAFSGEGGFAARYERETDERVLALGKGPGLKSYRQWLYARLGSLDAARKRRMYYTPEEIDAYLAKPK